MNEDDVGSYYIDENDDVWRMVGFTSCPSVTMARVKDGVQDRFGVGGLASNKYTKLTKVCTA